MSKSRPQRRQRRRIDAVVGMDAQYEAKPAEEEAASADTGASAKKGDEKPEAKKEADTGVQPDEGAMTFGVEGKAWLKVDISEDQLSATLTALSYGGAKIKGQEIVTALHEQYKVVHGLSAATIKTVAANARKLKVVRGEFVVAQGSAAEPGEDGRIDLKFLEESVQSTLPFRELVELLGKEDADVAGIVESDLLSILVTPGECLGVVVPPTQGTPSFDVLGNRVPEPGKAVELVAGERVETTQEGFASTLYGYVCVLEGVISVLPPIWVTSDWQKAYYVHLSEAREAKQPQSDWLLEALRAKGVTSSIDETAIEKLSEQMIATDEKKAALLAEGTPPVDGVDTHVKYTFDPEKRAGKILEDGSIDFRERNAAIGTIADQLLGEVVPATEGQPGRDIRGEEAAARDGVEKSFTGGANVRSPIEGDKVMFYAEIGGAVNVSGESIEVQPIVNISGDVDFDTGNIDLPMNVEIGGSVRSGFTVKSGGSVLIAGTVENGADVHAKGDIVVAKGIFGDSTKIVAMGNVETKLIQNSMVMANGDVNVGAYIFNGMVRAGGQVTIEEGGSAKAGSIVGGEVMATAGVRAKLIGSADTDRTVVGVSPTTEQQQEMARIHKTLRECEDEIPNLVSKLGIARAESLERG